MLADAFRLLRRGALPWVVLAAVAALAVLTTLGRDPLTWQFATWNALGTSSIWLIPATATLGIWLFGVDNDHHLAGERYVTGSGGHRWNVARLAALIATATVLVAGFVAISVLLAKPWAAPADAPLDSGNSTVLDQLALVILSVLLLSCWVAGACACLTTRSAVTAGALTLVGLLVVAATPKPFGTVLTALFPLTSLRAVTVDYLNTSATIQKLGVLAAIFTTIVAVWSLRGSATPHRTRHSGNESREHAAAPRWRGPLLSTATVVGCVTALALVVPVGVATQLPWQYRPSNVLDNLAGTGPADVVRTFEHNLRTGNTAAADAATIDGSARTLLGRMYAPLTQSPGASALLMLMQTPDTAAVNISNNAPSASGQLWVLCTHKTGDRWRITKLTQDTAACAVS